MYFEIENTPNTRLPNATNTANAADGTYHEINDVHFIRGSDKVEFEPDTKIINTAKDSGRLSSANTTTNEYYVLEKCAKDKQLNYATGDKEENVANGSISPEGNEYFKLEKKYSEKKIAVYYNDPESVRPQLGQTQQAEQDKLLNNGGCTGQSGANTIGGISLEGNEYFTVEKNFPVTENTPAVYYNDVDNITLPPRIIDQENSTKCQNGARDADREYYKLETVKDQSQMAQNDTGEHKLEDS